MIAAPVPEDIYQVQLHQRWISKAKKPLQNPKLPAEIRDFSFKGTNMEFWGKALNNTQGMSGIWLRIQFALHDHSLPTIRLEYNPIIEAWETSKNSKRIIFVAAAIVGQ